MFISLDRLGKDFDKKPCALDDLTLDLPSGMIGLIGPNGAGKSTLLKVLLGNMPYHGTLGYLDLAGDPVIGYVPQTLEFDRLTPLTVLDLFAFSLTRVPAFLHIPAHVREKAEEALSQVHAEHLMRSKIGQLSGGELQRVLLALALSGDPQCLLLDEPGSALDAKGLDTFYALADDLRHHQHMAVIIVSHDLNHIADHVDRLLLLANGKLVGEGTPQQVYCSQAFNDLFGKGGRGAL